jgi:hypothetical protein
MPITPISTVPTADIRRFATMAIPTIFNDGHLHHMHGDRVDEHALAVDATNPVRCTPEVNAPTRMVRDVGTKLCHTATTSITWWMAGCIIRMMAIAMITDRCNWPEAGERLGKRRSGVGDERAVGRRRRQFAAAARG